MDGDKGTMDIVGAGGVCLHSRSRASFDDPRSRDSLRLRVIRRSEAGQADARMYNKHLPLIELSRLVCSALRIRLAAAAWTALFSLMRAAALAQSPGPLRRAHFLDAVISSSHHSRPDLQTQVQDLQLLVRAVIERLVGLAECERDSRFGSGWEERVEDEEVVELHASQSRPPSALRITS